MSYKNIKKFIVLFCYVLIILISGCEIPNPGGDTNKNGDYNNSGTTYGGNTGGNTGDVNNGEYPGGGTTGNFSVYTNPDMFKNTLAPLGIITAVDFEDAAAVSGNTTKGAPVFDGNYYANRGVTFSSPQGYPLYIAPGGLFWNINKSLSVGNFPFDQLQNYYQHDNLIIKFSTAVKAAGLDVIDSRKPTIIFKDSNGGNIAALNLADEYMQYRSFMGIISNGPLIKEIHIVDEPPNDGDDVNYDNIIFVK